MPDSDSALGSRRGTEGAEEVLCRAKSEASASCGVRPGGGSVSTVGSTNCETSGCGETDRKDAELVSDCASEDGTNSTLHPSEDVEAASGDCC